MGSNASLMLKLPRKNAVQHIESEQAKLIKLIDEVRASMKDKTRQLLALQPNLTEMDPFSVELLLREQKKDAKKLAGDSSSDSN